MTATPTPVALLRVCGPRPDPDDPLIENDGYLGHVPRDLNPRTGRSKTHAQVLNTTTGLYEWRPQQ